MIFYPLLNESGVKITILHRQYSSTRSISFNAQKNEDGGTNVGSILYFYIFLHFFSGTLPKSCFSRPDFF